MKIINFILAFIHGTSRCVGAFCGILLMLTIGFFAVDIISRQMDASIGGAEEMSGYVMAIITSWGVAYGLVHLSHVRIDLLRTKLHRWGRVAFDGISLISFCLIAWLIAFKTWGVLEKTLKSSAKSNTPLETPLWIPQVLWWSGWVWLMICSTLLVICFVYFVIKKDTDSIEKMAGIGGQS